MFCPQCGNNNADGVAFCANCGAPLNAQQQQQAPQQQYQAPQQQYQAPQQQYQAPQYQPQMPYTPVPKPELPGKGMGITAMILGIAAISFYCFWFLSIPLGIVALVLGANASGKAKRAGMKNGMAVAGIITGSIGLGIGAIWFLYTIAFGYEMEYYFDYYFSVFHKFFK